MSSASSGVSREIHDVVIVGGGAAGIAAAASLLRRRPSLDVAIVEPQSKHYYQPGWTMVGGGVFNAASTEREEADFIPGGARWIKEAVAGFAPESDEVILSNGERVAYRALIAAPGIKLDWAAVEGLPETLGKNGVTSNYRFDLAPYTWRLVQEFRGGRALFTQPPLPIKCAGAPQKALYLSCDHWLRNGVLANAKVEFHNAGGLLFGVKEYVPALMEYIKKYGVDLNFGSRLVKIDGAAKTAWFEVTKGDVKEIVARGFDMIHICPPQCAPDVVRSSALADAAGWIDVDQTTLQHKRFPNVFGLGDAASTPNAKTAAAARKQAPIAAENVLCFLAGNAAHASYDGYGSCPLTVERGKIVFAEFGYGGKLLPTFPKWLIDGTKPSRLAWFLKERILPPIYWKAMLKGREWLARPTISAKS
ncbi:NAD(P)/FAD-dependent oxidoreductase [Methylocapsa acidiphila]|uniref:NAD(P)/FAD-dependent oxidoreductase n=1 Tax=Methylocapsa acidiphila TaxID=133552 RepID=UPI00040B3D69